MLVNWIPIDGRRTPRDKQLWLFVPPLLGIHEGKVYLTEYWDDELEYYHSGITQKATMYAEVEFPDPPLHWHLEKDSKEDD